MQYVLQLELLHDSKGAADNEHYFQHFAAHLGMDGQVRSGGVSRMVGHHRSSNFTIQERRHTQYNTVWPLDTEDLVHVSFSTQNAGKGALRQ